MIVFAGNIFLQLPHQVISQTKIYATIYDSVEESEFENIREQLSSMPHVSNVVFSSKEEELQQLLEYYEDDGTLKAMYSGENNPLQNTYEIEVDEFDENVITSTVQEVYNLSDIDQVRSNYDSINEVVNRIYTVNFIIYAFFFIITLALILKLVYNFFKKKQPIKETKSIVLKDFLLSLIIFVFNFAIQCLLYNTLFSSISYQLNEMGLSLLTLQEQLPVAISISLLWGTLYSFGKSLTKLK